MGNVIQFRQKDDLLNCFYAVDDKDKFSVVMNDCCLQIEQVNKDQVRLIAFGRVRTYSRKELAEFLHVASLFVDEEAKWLPNVELIYMDY